MNWRSFSRNLTAWAGSIDDKGERIKFKLTRDLDKVDKEWRASVKNAAETGTLLMTEEEITRAFMVPVSNKLWCAIQQLLATAEDNAQQEAADGIDRTNFALGKIMVADGYADFRAEMIKRRILAVKEIIE